MVIVAAVVAGLLWLVDVLVWLLRRLGHVATWLVDRPGLTVPVGVSAIVWLLVGPWAVPGAWVVLVVLVVVWARFAPRSYGRLLGSWLLVRWHGLLAWAGRWRFGTQLVVADAGGVQRRPAPPGVVRAVGCAHVVRDAAAHCERCGGRVVALADPDDPARLVWFDDLEVS